MYSFGQALSENQHFYDHQEHQVPVQIYLNGEHVDIGFVTQITASYVRINDTFYHRSMYTFVSRPGY
ncbi:hypothetical protein [Paenibacillus turpanensis]|uniref:hypothetical protein n=1 Tax=Paenibacillus turpanensis TaxID=2689078 RepID=UPI001408565A|nr:hypothetical protein [Paenibacillus turpanensis]